MTKSKIPAPLLKKSERAIQIAVLMLGNDAAAQSVENQAVALMYMPARELDKMHKRLRRRNRKPLPREPVKRSTAASSRRREVR